MQSQEKLVSWITNERDQKRGTDQLEIKIGFLKRYSIKIPSLKTTLRLIK